MSKDNDLEDVFKEVSAAIGDVTTSEPLKKDSDVSLAGIPSSKAAEFGRSSFPTEMSCNQVFDQVLKCFSIGGQVRHYYRYGELSYCQRQRDQLNLCMKSKLNPDDVRREKISQWYKQKLADQIRNGQTSEQIWKSRSEPLRRPFREDSADYITDGSN